MNVPTELAQFLHDWMQHWDEWDGESIVDGWNEWWDGDGIASGWGQDEWLALALQRRAAGESSTDELIARLRKHGVCWEMACGEDSTTLDVSDITDHEDEWITRRFEGDTPQEALAVALAALESTERTNDAH
jgi:hypothetical protein